MNSLSTIRKISLALLFALSCVPAATQAFFGAGITTFIAGAVIAGPYVRRILCPEKPNQTWPELHREASKEASDNLSAVWVKGKKLTELVSKTLEKFEKENKKTDSKSEDEPKKVSEENSDSNSD